MPKLCQHGPKQRKTLPNHSQTKVDVHDLQVSAAPDVLRGTTSLLSRHWSSQSIPPQIPKLRARADIRRATPNQSQIGLSLSRLGHARFGRVLVGLFKNKLSAPHPLLPGPPQEAAAVLPPEDRSFERESACDLKAGSATADKAQDQHMQVFKTHNMRT